MVDYEETLRKIEETKTFIAINSVILAMFSILCILYIFISVKVLRKIKIKNKIMIMLLICVGLLLVSELVFYALSVYLLE